MNYFVRQMILGPAKSIPIEPERYSLLEQARNALIAAKAIEEKYDLIISNYLEFEKELLIRITDSMILSRYTYDASNETIAVLNRRIVNLLTSTKLYYDQIKPQIRLCDLGNEDLENTASLYFNREYDGCFEYRFMENLRNYVQHCGLAVHNLSLPFAWEGEGDFKQMVYKIRIFSTKSELEQDPKFKKRPVFNECSEKIDLIAATRVYIECLSKVHSDIRNLVEKNINQARSSMEAIISEYEQANNGKSLGISAYGVNSDNPLDNVVCEIPLLLDWDNLRINLLDKNKKLTHLSKYYVSSSYL